MFKSLLKAPAPKVDNNEEQQMTLTILINFLPLSHGGSTWNVASIGPLVSEKIFEHTHTYIPPPPPPPTHTHTSIHQKRYILLQHTYIRSPGRLRHLIKMHMYSCTPEHNSWEVFQMIKIWGIGWGGSLGGGVFEGKAQYFCGRWRGRFFFFHSSLPWWTNKISVLARS